MAIMAEKGARAKSQRRREQEILQRIAAMTSVEFAEQAADVLDSRKHVYSFSAYLGLLEDLQMLTAAGVPNCLALEAVQTCVPVELIIATWQSGKM